jgi:hypothetical protein
MILNNAEQWINVFVAQEYKIGVNRMNGGVLWNVTKTSKQSINSFN